MLNHRPAWPADIPDLTTAGAALYIHDFVEWATDVGGWVSDFAPAHRDAKIKAIADMRAEGVSQAERDFLVACEEDRMVAKQLSKLPVVAAARVPKSSRALGAPCR